MICKLAHSKNVDAQVCPVAADSVSAVYRGPKDNLKIKEINDLIVPKRAPSENGP
jgi:hypothetical protein